MRGVPDALADLDEIWEYQAGEVRLEPGTTTNQGDFSGLTKGDSPPGRAYRTHRLRPHSSPEYQPDDAL
jgi:hypothetical protein